MKTKPEIGFDRENGAFCQDGKYISVQEARERWFAIDSDWTQGAYRVMQEMVMAEEKQK